MANATSELDFISDQVVVQFWTYASVPKGMTYAQYAAGGNGAAASSGEQAASDHSAASSSENTTPAPTEEWSLLVAKMRLRQAAASDPSSASADPAKFVEEATNKIASAVAHDLVNWIQ